MPQTITIKGRSIGPGHPAYIIAEMSANHNQDYQQAVDLIVAAKEAGADAVKLQTYTPDTLTIDCDNDFFKIKGTIWDGRNLYDLYGEAYTPWEWQPKLKVVADELGIDLFSSPFDESAVDFLESMDVPAYKIASFENVDLPLLRRIAQTGKPIIMSTGMATLAEIDEAVRTIQEANGDQLALLKCTSAYPAMPEDMDLRSIPHLAEAFGLPTGLSDHTLGTAVPIAAVSLGACIIEKHFTISRDIPGPDSEFSLEPSELKTLVESVHIAEKALGSVQYGVSDREAESRVFRRSLFVVEDVAAGEVFTSTNVRSIRPGYGLHTRYLDQIIGRRSSRQVSRGTPMDWDLLGG
jgi:N-acetylneuraminate synthase